MQQFLSFLSGKIPAAFIDSFNPLPKWLNAVGKMFTFKIPSDVKLTKNHKYFQVYEQVSRNARRHQTGSLHKYNNPSLLEFKIDVEKWLECPQCKPMYKEKKHEGWCLTQSVHWKQLICWHDLTAICWTMTTTDFDPTNGVLIKS